MCVCVCVCARVPVPPGRQAGKPTPLVRSQAAACVCMPGCACPLGEGVFWALAGLARRARSCRRLNPKLSQKLLGRFGFSPFLCFLAWAAGRRGLAKISAKPFKMLVFGFARVFFSRISLPLAFGPFFAFFCLCFLGFGVFGPVAAARAKPFEMQGFCFARDFFSNFLAFVFLVFLGLFGGCFWFTFRPKCVHLWIQT